MPAASSLRFLPWPPLAGYEVTWRVLWTDTGRHGAQTQRLCLIYPSGFSTLPPPWLVLNRYTPSWLNGYLHHITLVTQLSEMPESVSDSLCSARCPAHSDINKCTRSSPSQDLTRALWPRARGETSDQDPLVVSAKERGGLGLERDCSSEACQRRRTNQPPY